MVHVSEKHALSEHARGLALLYALAIVAALDGTLYLFGLQVCSFFTTQGGNSHGSWQYFHVETQNKKTDNVIPPPIFLWDSAACYYLTVLGRSTCSHWTNQARWIQKKCHKIGLISQSSTRKLSRPGNGDPWQNSSSSLVSNQSISEHWATPVLNIVGLSSIYGTCVGVCI